MHPGKAAREVRQPLHRHERANERVVPRAEPLDFTLLRVGGHDQFHALQRLDQKAADIGAALPKHRDLRLEPPAVIGECPQAQGDKGDADEKQTHVHPDEDGDGADQEQDVSDPRERGLRGDPLDFTDVVVDARHDVAEACAGVETRRQSLQMAVHRQAHLEQDVRRDARVAEPAHHVQARN